MMDPRERMLFKAIAAEVREYVSWMTSSLRAQLDALDQKLLAIPAGPRGEVGPAGVSGPPGPAGERGLPGEAGAAGERGLTVKGDPGERGEPGLPGSTGPQGMAGPHGEKGEPGIAGAVGPAGKDGQNGVDGKDGAPGERGEPGPIGLTGSVGPMGEKGLTGPDGSMGPMGPQGEPGPMGLGVIGPPGPIGEKGIDGKDGRDGRDGVSKDGRDGKDGAPGRDALEIEILSAIDPAKSYPRGTFAEYRGGLIRAVRNTDPVINGDGMGPEKHGWHVIVNGLAGVQCRLIDGRTLTIEHQRTSGVTDIFTERIPVLLYREIYKAGATYEQGDVVTSGGSSWHCMAASTTAAPGNSTDWRLMVREGRAGKPGKDGKDGERGAAGPRGQASYEGLT